jgi:hypothetical protein
MSKPTVMVGQSTEKPRLGASGIAAARGCEVPGMGC